MKAARIHRFGSPEVIVIDDLSPPAPREGELLVRAAAAGVGPWDALLREGKTALVPPFILGSELAGVVEAVGPTVADFQPGDEVYGATNEMFSGGYAEYVLASAAKMAHKSARLSMIESASVPIVAVTAWQMLFDYANAHAGEAVLIHGAAGNVGAYAVQFAKQAGLRVFATASARDIPYVRDLGAEDVVDYATVRFEDAVPPVDIVIDTVGRDSRDRSYRVLKPDGILVSVVTPFPTTPPPPGIRHAFFIVDVTTARLKILTEWFNRGSLTPQIRAILPLEEARTAHELLGSAARARGKIVLRMARSATPS